MLLALDGIRKPLHVNTSITGALIFHRASHAMRRSMHRFSSLTGGAVLRVPGNAALTQHRLHSRTSMECAVSRKSFISLQLWRCRCLLSSGKQKRSRRPSGRCNCARLQRLELPLLLALPPGHTVGGPCPNQVVRRPPQGHARARTDDGLTVLAEGESLDPRANGAGASECE